MKRKVIATLAIVIAILLVVYLVVPRQTTHTYTSQLNCAQAAVDRFLLDRTKWPQWWPATGNKELLYDGYQYRVDEILVNGFQATVFNQTDSARLLLVTTPVKDGTNFTWITETISCPASRLLQTDGIRQNMERFVSSVNAFFNREENIYGMKIALQKVKDSSLVSTKKTFGHYPDVNEVYGLIQTLKAYVKQQGGEESGVPMLNIHEEENQYVLMVAIPLKRDIATGNGFTIRKMVLGKILVGEVRGGIAAIQKGEEQLAAYVIDHHLSAPAIPFQSLVTNRQAEKDTSKWITWLNYPIF